MADHKKEGWFRSDRVQAGSMRIAVGDLVRGCPALDYNRTQFIRAFRERWSHKVIILGPPQTPDPSYKTMFWTCSTDLIWPVIGPEAILTDILEVYGTGGGNPRMWLCRHEIKGD